MALTKMADLSKIPLVALSIDTKMVFSTLLNPTKRLPTDDGIPRDWRGLAHLCAVDGETIPSLASHSDPTGHLLTIVQNTMSNCFMKDLASMLSKIDRWDVLDDAHSLLERDSAQYLDRMERCGTSAGIIQVEAENKVLTMDDLYRAKQGMDKQCYDAFVLFADDDMEFVKEMIDVLENKYQLKLCLKDRDLMGGIPFEHEAVMQLISERCNRLIVVVSPNFIKSPANSFFLNYGQAVGIGTGQRKIIPCLYKKCQLPPQLAYQFILDYTKNGLYDFWGRLQACVQVIAQDACTKSPLPTQQLSHHSNDVEPLAAKSLDSSNSPRNNVPCSTSIVGSLKKLDRPIDPPDAANRITKIIKTKKLIPWPKRKREKNRLNSVQEIEPATETISITVSLPSLNDLPSLDTIDSTPSSELKNLKKNLVGTYFKKVQSLLSKQ